jgi:hypothetical protein
MSANSRASLNLLTCELRELRKTWNRHKYFTSRMKVKCPRRVACCPTGNYKVRNNSTLRQQLAHLNASNSDWLDRATADDDLLSSRTRPIPI